MVYLVRVFPIGGTDKVMKNCAKVPDACNEVSCLPLLSVRRGGGVHSASCPFATMSLYCLLRDFVRGEKVTYTGRRRNLYEYVG